MEAARSCTRDTPAAGVPGQIRSAACKTMELLYLRQGSGLRGDDTRDAIELLIVADDPVFYARFNPTSAAVCMPATHKADALVIFLDRGYFERQARLVLGGAPPQLPEAYRAADNFVRELGALLLSDFRQGQLPATAYLESLAAVLAFHLATRHCRRHPAAPLPAGLPCYKLNRVFAFVADHIRDALPLQQLAATAHLSPYHFARMFKQATGCTPHTYVTRQRIELAKALLRDTTIALVEVAASVGFETQSHFTGVFHRYAGVTPRAFRLDARASQGSGA